ncbi:MAG: PASTA domain-containing protein, partial [Actinobacteria bacterium]|nr:PASTA domain-containing protein [Actinomycetota bacterium]
TNRTVLSPADDGRVIEQTPGASTLAPRGSRVTIVVGVLALPTTTSTSTTTTTTTTTP